MLPRFHDVELPSSARDGLVTLLDKFDLKIKGIGRGREIQLSMAGSRCIYIDLFDLFLGQRTHQTRVIGIACKFGSRILQLHGGRTP